MAFIDKEKAQIFFRTECLAKYPASFANGLLAAADQLANMPAADVAEVVHGEWEKVRVVSEEYGHSQVYYQHKDCKISPTELYESPYEHCPRCGAKMDGKEDENV